jgi:Mn-dependent DtxR family transcriptional regulator
MIKLGPNQEKILHAVKSLREVTTAELSNLLTIEERVVKNIISEFTHAGLVKVSPEKVISLRTDYPSYKRVMSDEKDEWAAYKPVLKNLSRVV